jgi:Cu-processing system ATP-binding protein
MAVIRRAAAEGAGVADIELMPPSLDELYAHFLRSQEQSR